MPSHRHQHVITRSQVALFGVDGLVKCHFRDGTVRVLGATKVGVRKNFYSVKNADGSISTEFERAINPIETNGIKVLRGIEANWPPEQEARVKICEFLALQAVRSPAYRYFFEQRRESSLAERAAQLDQDHRTGLKKAVRSDEFRIENLVNQIGKMATMFGSMHSALLRFGSPRLLCSDHPLAPVPFMDVRGAAVSAIPGFGFLNTIEFRFPIDPERALLFTWREFHDDFPVFDCKLHHLKSLNASVRDQAEEHWFHRPDVSAPCGSGTFTPLSFELFDDYELTEAIRSERRSQAQQTIEGMIDNDVEDKMQLMSVELKATGQD